MHFNRKYSKHPSLEIMNYKICGYFGQRRTISKRKVNANMFSRIITIEGHLNKPVHLWYWLKFYIALTFCCQMIEVYGCIELADSVFLDLRKRQTD